MPDRSKEETLEEELGMVDDGSSESPDSSADVDIDDLEAELGMGGTDDGAADRSSDDVGLDRDASDEYADLLGDAPADSGGPTATADEDGDGGLLSGLFGGSGSDGETSESSAGGAEPASATPGDVGASTAGTDVESVLDDVDAGSSTDAGAPATTDGQSTASRRSRLAGFLSPKAFLAAMLAIAVLGGVGRTFVPIVGGPAGIAAGGLLVGLVSGEHRYLEVAVGGALVGALGAFAGGLSIAFAAGAAQRLLAVGGVGGLVLALIGAYFGNDLRAGLVGGDDRLEQ